MQAFLAIYRRVHHQTCEGEKPMTSNALRGFASKLGQLRRVIVRTELALSALQAAFWVVLVGLSLAAVLLVRRRLTASHRGEDLQPAEGLDQDGRLVADASPANP
jgi:hypothetical protein